MLNTLHRLMKQAVEKSKGSVHCYYVYEKDGAYQLSNEWQKNWLFRAYPGGRKEISGKGKRLLGL